jgi:hypothetical protein
MSELKDEARKQPLMHRVKVNVGYTRNMKNFESLRVDIGLEQEGYGHPNNTFDKVYEWCEEKLVEKMQELEAELKS